MPIVRDALAKTKQSSITEFAVPVVKQRPPLFRYATQRRSVMLSHFPAMIPQRVREPSKTEVSAC